MISNAQQKYVQSLHQKKYRKLNRTFIVEGRKNVTELLASDYTIQHLFCVSSFTDSFDIDTNRIVVNEKELNKISTLKTPDQALAVVYQKESSPISLKPNEIALILDGVSDPGNLGTIVRTADWYGIENIICSEDTVDFYNPKVIMSTMGSFTRVNVQVTNLPGFLKDQQDKHEVFGAFLNGKSIYDIKERKSGFLVLGSESHGISSSIEQFITKKITIPRIGGAESLNVAISTAVLLDNLHKLK